MKKVGFVGLGNIGIGMAKSILRKDFELIVYDLREEPLRELTKLGAQAAKSLSEIGERSDVVMVQVFDGPQVKEVILGKCGLVETMKPGSTIICGSTILASEVKEVAEAVEKKGINMLDSPVSGGPVRAVEGVLTVMVAGKKNVFEEGMDVFKAMGTNISYVGGEIGMGQVTKAAQLVLSAATLAGTIEALVLGVKAGIRPESLLEVLSTSTAGSYQFKSYTKLIMERNFKSISGMATTLKDLSIVTKTGKDYGVPLFSTAIVYEMAVAANADTPEEDEASVIKVLEKMAGVEVRKTT